MYRVLSWIQGVLIPLLGPPGLFAVAFVDSSFLTLPEINDVLVVSAALKDPATGWMAVVLTTLGSVAGGSTLWLLGRRGGEALLQRRFRPPRPARPRAGHRPVRLPALAFPPPPPPPQPLQI